MGDLNINRNMFNTLKSQEAKDAVNNILADGKVDGTDKAELEKLKTQLQTAAKQDTPEGAKANDIDKDESTLIGSMTDTGLFSDEGITAENLKVLQNAQKTYDETHSDVDFANALNAKSVTSQGIFSNSTRVLRLRDIPTEEQSNDGLPATPDAGQSSGVETQGAATNSNESTPPASVNTTPSAPISAGHMMANALSWITGGYYGSEELAQSIDHSLAVGQILADDNQSLNASQTKLNDATQVLTDALQDPTRVPDEKLLPDLKSGLSPSNQTPDYSFSLLQGLSKNDPELAKSLESSGLTADDFKSGSPVSPEKQAKLDELANKALDRMSKDATYAASSTQSYRNQLIDVANQYKTSPSKENLAQLRSFFVDNSYAFEPSAETGGLASSSEMQSYKSVKATVMDVEQKSDLLTQQQTALTEHNYTMPASTTEVNDKLQQSDNYAAGQLKNFASKAQDLIDKVEKNPAAFPNVDLASLKASMDEIGTYTPASPPNAADFQLKHTPPGQADLENINKVWVELENAGMAAGLSNSDSAIVDKAFAENAGTDQAQDPTVQGLKQNPVLLAHPELVDMLKDPANKPLADAIRNNDTAKIQSLVAENDDVWMSGFMWDYDPSVYETEGANLNLGKTRTEDMLALAASLSNTQPPESRDAVLNNLDTLSSTIKDNASLSTAQARLQAKTDFNNVFWKQGSTIEMAQAAVKSAVETRTTYTNQMQLAQQVLESQLARPDLNDKTKVSLQGQLDAVKDAVGALQTGNMVSEGPELEQVTRALASKENSTNLGERLIRASGTSAMLGDLQNSLSDPDKVQVLMQRLDDLAKTDPKYSQLKSQLGPVTNDPATFVQNMEKVLSEPDLRPEIRSTFIQNISEIQQLVDKGGDPSIKNEDFIAFGNQVPEGRNDGGSPFNTLSDMTVLSTFLKDKSSSQNSASLQGSLGKQINDMNDWAVSTAKSYADQHDGAVIPRSELYQQMSKNLDSFKGEQLSHAIDNLSNIDQVDDISSKFQTAFKDNKIGSEAVGQAWQHAGLSGQINLRATPEELNKFKSQLESELQTERNLSRGGSNEKIEAMSKMLAALNGTNGNPGLIQIAQTRKATLDQILGTDGSISSTMDTHISSLATGLKSSEFQGLVTVLNPENLADPAKRQAALEAIRDPVLKQEAATVIRLQMERLDLAQMENSVVTGQPIPEGTIQSRVHSTGVNKAYEALYGTIQPGASRQDRLTLATRLENLDNFLSTHPKGPQFQAEFTDWLKNNGFTDSQIADISGSMTSMSAMQTNFNEGEKGLSITSTALEGIVPGADKGGQGNVPGFQAASFTATAVDAPVEDNATTTTVTPDGTAPAATPAAPTTDLSADAPPGSGGRRHPGGWARISGDLGRWADRAGLPRESVVPRSVAPTATNPSGMPPTVMNTDWASAQSEITRFTGRIIQDAAANNSPVFDQLVNAERSDLHASNERSRQTVEALSNYSNTVLRGLPDIAQNLGVTLPPDVMQAANAAQAETGPADPDLSPEANAAIKKADDLAYQLTLAPVPTTGGDELMNKLISQFLESIRDLDMKTRQIVLARLAKQMMDNLITTFYKDKRMANDKHHNEALERMSKSAHQQIEASNRSHMAATANGSQSVASISGDVKSATIGEALNLASIRKDFNQQLEGLSQGTPPKITALQRQQLASKFEGIIAAGGTGPTASSKDGLEDDRLAALSLAGTMRSMRIN